MEAVSHDERTYGAGCHNNLNVHIPNNSTTSKGSKVKRIKGKNKKIISAFGDFNTPLPLVDMVTRQRSN